MSNSCPAFTIFQLLLVALVDKEEGGKMAVVVCVEEGQLLGQGDEVVAQLEEIGIDAGETPKAVFVLVDLIGFHAHHAALFAQGLEVAALFLAPTAHLIAHWLDLLG